MEQTIVKPTPGGRAAVSKAQPQRSADSTVVISKSPELVNNDSVVAYGDNPLLAEANGLLSIIGQIRATATHSDPLPLWVVCSVTSALLVCIFMYFSYELNKASNQTFAQLVNLIQPTPAVSNPMVESKSAPIAERISMYLATEIGKDLVTVEALQDRVRISLRAQDLFESGSASVVAYIQPVISKVARTLEATQGKIIITGHTDDRPIFTSKYPSNWHLSLARATSLSEQLIANSALKGRVIPEGLGDARPLVENDSEENRAMNRRIEIDLIVGN